MASAALSSSFAIATRNGTPPLQNGERLTRLEFEQRYKDEPSSVKAELLEGVVFMSPPVGYGSHGGPHFDLIGWLAVYRAMTPGVGGADNSSLRLGAENEPQPHACLLVPAALGGQTVVDKESYIASAPELVAEIAGSSVSYDLDVKMNVYLKHGVREYLVWRVFDAAIDWFIRRDEKFERLAPGTDGILRSEVFPGLWLDPLAMLKYDFPTLFRVLQEGLSSPGHAEFVSLLQKKAEGNNP